MSEQHTPKDTVHIDASNSLAVRALRGAPNAITPSHSAEFVALIAQRDELLEALRKADEFIDLIRQEIHHERIADWFPEGAHNSAEAMSEAMRLIGNRIADFDVARAAIAKAEGGGV